MPSIYMAGLDSLLQHYVRTIHPGKWVVVHYPFDMTEIVYDIMPIVVFDTEAEARAACPTVNSPGRSCWLLRPNDLHKAIDAVTEEEETRNVLEWLMENHKI